MENKLLTREWYLNSLSLFFRNSFGMVDRMDTYYGQLMNIVNFENGIFNRINIFSVDEGGLPNYFTINSDIDKNGTEKNSLDKIATIYNIKREQRIQYTIPTSDALIAELLQKQPNTLIDETITLKNYELLICIQLAIVENNYDGTYAGLQELYRYGFTDENGQVKKIYCAEDLKLRYEFVSPNSPLTCTTRLSTAPALISNGFINIVKLFYAGLLTINSLGIIYTRTAFNDTYPGFFQNVQSGSLTPTSLSRFYLSIPYPSVTRTVSASRASYTVTLDKIYGSVLTITINGVLISSSTYTYNQAGKNIVINKAVSANDVIVVRLNHSQAYENIAASTSQLVLTQYDTSEIIKVFAGSGGSEVEIPKHTSSVQGYSFNAKTGVITFDTAIAAGNNIYVCCSPIYATFM